MRHLKHLKRLLYFSFALLIAEIASYVLCYFLGYLENKTVDMFYAISTPTMVFCFFGVLIFYISSLNLVNELKIENSYNLGRESTFYNFHAFEKRVRLLRFWRYKKNTAYVVAFSASNNSVTRSTNRNSVIAKLNGELSEYFVKTLSMKSRKIRSQNVFCFYHGYFILYSFANNEFVEQFISDLSINLFRIAEENQIHVFVQPYFGVTVVSNPKETVFKSIDNALTARNFSEKNFQEKTYYDDNLVKTVTDDDIKELLHAIENKEFVVYYQPKFSLNSNEIISSEALIRWNSPKYGFSGPDKFLPKAEEGGIMHDIDMYVFRRVCEDLSETKRKGRRLLPVSVNFSLYEFYAPNFLTDLTDILHSFDLDPKYIEIEITESTSQANSFLAISYLKKIKEQGLNILMDDFGIGYSNINNLNKLPIDKVKIDKSLIDGIVDDVKTRESVRYLIQLCKINEMECIAEGVDNEKQVEVLRKLKCDTIQGYYYSRPISKEAYDNFLLDNQFEKKKTTRGGNKE